MEEMGTKEEVWVCGVEVFKMDFLGFGGGGMESVQVGCAVVVLILVGDVC